MELKIYTPIMAYNGKDTAMEVEVVADGENKKQVMTPILFSKIIGVAISNEVEGHPFTTDEKVMAYVIGTKCFGKDPASEEEAKNFSVNITNNEIVFLTKQIGLIYTPLVYGRWREFVGDLK